ncbi:MAG TPA: N-formylglutamate amidohydrolase [Octadecabacter sp.]|nr:N-formylglutamate amidohydrolase [Octadecabacter sp.]
MTTASFEPFSIHGANRRSRWLITCDHASNAVPPCIGGGSLGLPDEDMQRHIAYDVGAAGVTRALADALGAPAVLSNFSRMVIDPNRGLNDPTLLMKLYDGSVIPANRNADAIEKARRVDAFYSPYHNAYAELAARQGDTVIVAVHSFTPQLNGRPPRPWHIGILHAFDDRLSNALLGLLNKEDGLCVGDNEPYAGHLPGDAIDRHALQTSRANTLIELRSDLIETADQQVAWAKRLAPILTKALIQMETSDAKD